MIEDNDAYLNKKDKIIQVITKIRKNLYERNFRYQST